MNQPLPTVRELYLPGFIPQAVAIALATWILHVSVPALSWFDDLLYGALAYLMSCCVMRAIFARHHSEGIRAYRARRFDDAVEHNLANYAVFERHQVLDRLRHLVFGTASRNPYRTIALCNAGYCEAMRGNQKAAIHCFIRALELTPDCANAKVGLTLVRNTALSDATPDT